MGRKVIQNPNENISNFKRFCAKAWKTSNEGFKNGKCLLQKAKRIFSLKSAFDESQEINVKDI